MHDPYKHQGPATGIYPDEDETFLWPDRPNDPYWHAKYVAYVVLSAYFAGLVGIVVFA